MVRLLIIILLAVSLVGLASFEQLWVRHVYRNLETDLAILRYNFSLVDEEGDVDTEENKELSLAMFHYWVRQERRLAMIARHSDLSQVSDSLIYIVNFVHFNNKEEASVGMKKLQYLIDTHQFNIATSVRNVI